MVEKLIRCTRCNKVIPQFGRFGDFKEASHLPGVEWSSKDLDEQKEFLRDHRDHPLEELSIDSETFVSDKPTYEPIKVAYVEASNGNQRFLIKRTRAALEQPAFYELIPGRIEIADVSLEIQEDELEKQISRMDGSFPLPADKIKRFIDAFREEVKSIAPESLNPEFEAFLPGDTSPLSYGSLSEDRWEKVLTRCGKDFCQSEIELIEEFIQENRNPGDVLSLQIKKTILISSADAK